MKEEVIRGKYDELNEQVERMDRLAHKTKHDRLDKLMWENFTNKPNPS